MRKSLAAAIATVLALHAGQASADVTITTGSKGGAYERWGNNLATMLKGLGYSPTVQRSKGSGENIARVAGGEAQLGFAQGDAIMYLGLGVEILADLGKECAFLVGKTDGRVTDEDDLQSEEDPVLTIGVGKQGTGSFITWGYMGKLEDGYLKSAAQYKGGARGLAAVSSGQMDAMLFVTAPGNLEHKLISAVNGDENLQFLDVDDGDLNDKLPNGTPVYTFEEVDTKSGWGGGVDTICTPVLLIAYPDADEDLLDDVAAQALSNKAALLHRRGARCEHPGGRPGGCLLPRHELGRRSVDPHRLRPPGVAGRIHQEVPSRWPVGPSPGGSTTTVASARSGWTR